MLTTTKCEVIDKMCPIFFAHVSFYVVLLFHSHVSTHQSNIGTRLRKETIHHPHSSSSEILDGGKELLQSSMPIILIMLLIG